MQLSCIQIPDQKINKKESGRNLKVIRSQDNCSGAFIVAPIITVHSC